MQPNTKEWYLFRRGRFSGSECYKLMGAKGGITTEIAKTYILEKASETLYDPDWIKEINTPATRWGKELEADALEYYSLAFNCEVEKPEPQVSDFSDDVAGCGDGIIYPKEGKPFGMEIKCPYDPTHHLLYMLMKTHDDLKSTKKEYYWQILFYMLLFGFDYYEFVSYDPRYVGKNRMFVLPIFRKDVEQDIIKLKENLLLAVEEKHRILKEIE